MLTHSLPTNAMSSRRSKTSTDSQWEAAMHGNIQGSRDGVDYNREALTVSRHLRSIYDADISRAVPGLFARLRNELGPDSVAIIEGVHADDRVRGSSAGGDPAKPFATVELIAGLRRFCAGRRKAAIRYYR
jgi:hypothetical protein